ALSVRYGDRKSSGNSLSFFIESTNPPTNERTYRNVSIRERGSDWFTSSVNYKHTFGANNHEITGDLDFRYRNGKEFTINESYEEDGTLSSGRKNTEDGPSRRVRAQIDYTLPLGGQNRLEAGLQTQFGTSVDDTKSHILDPSSGDYLLEDDYSYLVEYTRNIHSAYSMFNSRIDRFAYQLGLRGEFTDRLIMLPASNQSSTINRWDYFPTIHTSYSFGELVQIMASYTRRIRRPRGWYLEPFLTWVDQNNVRQGNPDLEPEYINSFEIAYQTHIGNTILSLESYYRERKNKIERVTAVYDTNVTITTFQNVGTDYTLGAEFMVDADLLTFWNLNFLGDLSQYRLEGVYNGRAYVRDNFNWSLRLNNTLMITPSTTLQVNARYRGPRISAQGNYKGYYSTDIALRQDFLERTMSITLQVRDIFETSKREGITVAPGLVSYTFSQRKAPIVLLHFRVNLNNFKLNRDSDQQGEDGMDDEF
ncbi:MAG: TonB-dependent receptor family protein, partial [Bacteroidetes bacterium]|nr:TonB-dependent receptor family protein [Bacteroidota bacterium]